jgi:hypothetical protein
VASKRTKPWDGKFDALPVDYLKGVREKMDSYGDRVQFSRRSGPLPSYQVINPADKKMAFDCDHHLLRAQEDDFSPPHVTSVLSMDQINGMINGVRMVGEKAKTVRVVRTSSTGTRTTVKQVEDQIAVARYEYFRTHRATLPPTIAEHSDEITTLMKQGKPAEEAFGAIIEKYYGS